jgi:hypothetical protein
MRRYAAAKFTDEELANLKAGKCWCGKDKSDFARGMRVYCTPEHREIWASKVVTWSEFRDKFLSVHGEYCDICGARNDTMEARQERRRERENAMIAVKAEHQDAIIASKLLDLEAWYEEQFAKAIDPEYITYREIETFARYHGIELPEVDEAIKFEVDHRLAIVNGGAEFDKNNLQVLCEACHRKKTREDLRIAAGGDSMATINMDDASHPGRLDDFH